MMIGFETKINDIDTEKNIASMSLLLGGNVIYSDHKVIFNLTDIETAEQEFIKDFTTKLAKTLKNKQL